MPLEIFPFLPSGIHSKTYIKMGCTTSSPSDPIVENLVREPNSKEPKLFPMIKVLIVGDSGVGKTQLLNRLAGEDYNPSDVATIGVDFKYRWSYGATYVGERENSPYKIGFQLMDTAGQEKYRCITHEYYRGAQAILVCFRIGCLDPISSVISWVEEAKQRCPELSKNKILLVGTQSDQLYNGTGLKGPFREPELSELNYFEVSAKQGHIEELENYFLAWADAVRSIRIRSVATPSDKAALA